MNEGELIEKIVALSVDISSKQAELQGHILDLQNMKLSEEELE